VLEEIGLKCQNTKIDTVRATLLAAQRYLRKEHFIIYLSTFFLFISVELLSHCVTPDFEVTEDRNQCRESLPSQARELACEAAE
jgi:hypothetical protein